MNKRYKRRLICNKCAFVKWHRLTLLAQRFKLAPANCAYIRPINSWFNPYTTNDTIYKPCQIRKHSDAILILNYC